MQQIVPCKPTPFEFANIVHLGNESQNERPFKEHDSNLDFSHNKSNTKEAAGCNKEAQFETLGLASKMITDLLQVS